uniref:Ubiquitin-like domain-containing protein n=1 Tax=viral metagenome TaxID=1070528 RepID=A0A6C0BRC9_9ZZZZ
METIPLTIKTLSPSGQYVIHVDLDGTVEQLKTLISLKISIPVHEQKLLFAGRILHDLHQSLRSCGILDATCVYLIREKAAQKHSSSQ